MICLFLDLKLLFSRYKKILREPSKNTFYTQIFTLPQTKAWEKNDE